MDFVRTKIPLPSRQRLSWLSPDGFDPQNLTDWSGIRQRIHSWRDADRIPPKRQLRSVFAVDALSVTSEVPISREECTGLDQTDILLDKHFIWSLAESSPVFREFVAQNWGQVHKAVFAGLLQPLNPEISSLVLYVTFGANGQAEAEDLEIRTARRKLCTQKHIPQGIFTADGDAQYGQTHSIQESFNGIIFDILEVTPTTRKIRIVCDLFHILKRARYRRAKPIPIVVR